ncbi:hypothetical protein L218DRAFT_1008816 [Marasmius fiardii PR-910]|nr:hypothetical protein L218DRAFT_1008816 [Marasmius fiardii PR-910]
MHSRLLGISALVSVASAQFFKLASENPAYIPNGRSQPIPGCITASSNADGASVVINECPSIQTSAETWEFDLNASGPQQFKIFGNKCLDVTGGVDADGTKLQIWTCDENNNNPNQMWTYDTNTDTLNWNGGANNKCADLTDGNINIETPIQLWTCSANDNQRFAEQSVNIEQTVSFVSALSPVDTRMCIAAESDSDGASVSMADCNQPGFQWWSIPASSFTGPIRILNGTKCLDMTDSNTANGTPLQVWSCVEGSTNQQWVVGDDASLHIRLAGQNKCVDTANSNAGTRLTISDCVDFSNEQRWFANYPSA